MIPHERRLSLRKTPEHLAYIGLPSNNGGIVLDVSEGGVGFHAIAPVEGVGPIQFRFAIDSATRIKAVGELAWRDATGKNGGIRFTELPDEIREQIRTWSGQSKTVLLDILPSQPEIEVESALSSKVEFAPVADISAIEIAIEAEAQAASEAEPTLVVDSPGTNPEIKAVTGTAANANSVPDLARNNPLLYNLQAPVYSAPLNKFSMFPLGLNMETTARAPERRETNTIKHPIAAIALTAILAFLTAIAIFTYVSTTLTGQFMFYWGEEMLREYGLQLTPPVHDSTANSTQASSKMPQN
jgi:hypothetical protein